jgi:apolipoprotein D and lipocalin family protein
MKRYTFFHLPTISLCLLWTSSSPLGVDGRLFGGGWWGNNDDDVEEENCPPLAVTPDFDLASYISAKWYVHEQAETTYLPLENNYCVSAQYEALSDSTFWGYTIQVNNTAKNIHGDVFGGILYAFQSDVDNEPAKLKVAPGFLPRFLAGPYWVLDYQESGDGNDADDDDGYALIVGGQPNVRTDNGCKTRNRWITSSGGLWIFTRSFVRNEELITMIRNKAANEFGLDVTILNPVDHSNATLCGYQV